MYRLVLLTTHYFLLLEVLFRKLFERNFHNCFWFTSQMGQFTRFSLRSYCINCRLFFYNVIRFRWYLLVQLYYWIRYEQLVWCVFCNKIYGSRLAQKHSWRYPNNLGIDNSQRNLRRCYKEYCRISKRSYSCSHCCMRNFDSKSHLKRLWEIWCQERSPWST